MFDYLIATDEGLIQSKEDEEKQDEKEDDALLEGEEGASLSEEGASLSEEDAPLTSEEDADLLDSEEANGEDELFEMSDEEEPPQFEVCSLHTSDV